MNDYYINTEGSVARRGWSSYTLATIASTQAPDGMSLARSPFDMVRDPKELLTPDAFVAEAKAALKTLTQLRDAQSSTRSIAGRCSSVPMPVTTCFWDSSEAMCWGVKPEPGGTARTVGDYASNYKSRVLPDSRHRPNNHNPRRAKPDRKLQF